MTTDFPMPPQWVTDALRRGMVIPAHPLALNVRRKWDASRQQGLTRYYHRAGAGGIAVGVHTTQFAIRDLAHGLLEPVLKLASETVRECDRNAGKPNADSTVLIAGICGETGQASGEAILARKLGYHLGLLSLGAFRSASDDQLLKHVRDVAREIPIFGFYLQPAAGGRLLSKGFWARMVEIPNVVAVKVAPFNRYQTLDVIRAVADSGRSREIALYTGNDDHILGDLLTEYHVGTSFGSVKIHFAGGLLGQWACGTKKAVDCLKRCQDARKMGRITPELLGWGAQLTEINAAIFDAANGFKGCIPGIHEALRRQGLLDNIGCLDEHECLSAGQSEEIDRVLGLYPEWMDS